MPKIVIETAYLAAYLLNHIKTARFFEGREVGKEEELASSEVEESSRRFEANALRIARKRY